MSHIHLEWVNRVDDNDRGSDSYNLPITLGRSSKNTITLKGPDAGVSRTHAELYRLGGSLLLTDLNSTNGTIFDGQRINEQKLHHGAAFEIGTYLFTLKLQVVCTNEACSRPVSIEHHLCPHCGRFLADAKTHTF